METKLLWCIGMNHMITAKMTPTGSEVWEWQWFEGFGRPKYPKVKIWPATCPWSLHEGERRVSHCWDSNQSPSTMRPLHWQTNLSTTKPCWEVMVAYPYMIASQSPGRIMCPRWPHKGSLIANWSLHMVFWNEHPSWHYSLELECSIP